MSEICDYWKDCENGINDNQCEKFVCERRNDIYDEFRPKKERKTMSDSIFKDLQELANLGYQIRLLINTLRGVVPDFLIDAIIESTTGYSKETEQ